MPPLIIGSGHNGLTTAFYLARAGLAPLVLERRDEVGGGAVTETIAKGFRCPTLAHAIGPLRRSIALDMRLDSRGIAFVRRDPRLLAFDRDGRVLAFSNDVARTASAIRPFSEKDAARYPEFCAALERLAAFLSPLVESTPPSLGGRHGDLWNLLKIGRRFRALGRDDGFRLLRWGPMAVADLVSEWFETDVLQAAIAARGIFGTAQGPWSAGTAAVLLLNAATDPVPGGSTITVAGGPGALTRAMADAAREAGAVIRTGAEVARILVREERVAGVVLASGEEILSDLVVSGADPRRTLLGLVDPIELDPGFLVRIRNYRSRGTVAKVNLALSGLPTFTGVERPSDLAGRLHIGSDLDYLERAFDRSKYGEISGEPYLDVTLPTIHDDSLAPPGRHVMSVHVQYTPYRLAHGLDWETARDEVAQNALRHIERFAPGIGSLVEHVQIITPVDLERVYGFTGGHIHHGELSLDQLFATRPVLGCSRYRTPIHGLYLCGAGTHPGGGLTGGSGQNAAREILKDAKAWGR